MNQWMIVLINMNMVAMVLFLINAVISGLLKKKLPSRYIKFLWILFFILLIFPLSHDIEPSVTMNNSYVPSGPVYDTSYIQPTPSTRMISEVKSSTWPIVEMVYIIGLLVLFVRHLIEYRRFYKLVKYATRSSYALKYPLYECEGLNVPIVKGIIKPKIYIPLNMPKEHLSFVLCHEINHIKKKDLLIKRMASIVCWFHWFNPFVWLGYSQLVKHIEMSCDEAVTKHRDLAFKKGYMTSMVELSLKRKTHHYGLAFKSYDVRDRINNMVCDKLMTKQWQSFFNTLILLLISVIAFNPLKSVMIQDPSLVSLDRLFDIILSKPSVVTETFDEVPAKLNWINPVKDGHVTQGFHKTHFAIDISGVEGQVFYASKAGHVVAIKTLKDSLKIVLDHGNGYESWYVSCKDALVTVGDEVHQGEVIGTIEFTGTGPHLHFSILKDGEFVDPTKFIFINNR